MAPVLPIYSTVLPGHNQETYQQLQAAVQTSSSPQVLMAVCDDLPLQRQLAATLEESLQRPAASPSTQLVLQAEVPDLTTQIQAWAAAIAPPIPSLLQVLGIEQLTYRGSDAQYQFLRSLRGVLPLWQTLSCTLLIWAPRPWLKQIQREAPALCQTVFEFLGEPTPISSVNKGYQAAFSPVRQWQYLGKPVPESPPTPPAGRTESGAISPPATAVPAIPPMPGQAAPPSPLSTPPPPFQEDLWELLREDLIEFEQSTSQGNSETKLTALNLPTWFEELALPVTDEASGAELPVSPPPSLPATRPSDIAAPPPTTPAEEAAWAIAYQLRDAVQMGDSSPATLESAIQHYEMLLTYPQSVAHPTEALNDLGSFYWLWAQQAQVITVYVERLMHSSSLYEAALAPVSPGTEAVILARVHTNLGSVYSLLAAHQDPVTYLNKAVRAFVRALHYTPVESFPTEYATLQTHLGTAYWSLAQHTQEGSHLHRAIVAYQEALHHAQPQTSPLSYAQLQNNLGIALWSLSRYGTPIPLLEKAIGAYRTALAYRTLDVDTAGCAATHNNLGTAYWDLGGHYPERSPDQFSAWKQAATAYETALLAVNQLPVEQLGFDPWATHHSLGVVYDQLAIILAPHATVQNPLLQRALRHYVQALTGWQELNTAMIQVAFQAIVRNLQLQARYLGIEVQQRSLSQIPAQWLPEIWRKL